MKPKVICVVNSKGIEMLEGSDIKASDVGTKAYGLALVPAPWTLPFFVISPDLHTMYASGDYSVDILKQAWHPRILEAMQNMGFDPSQDVFLRSNMCEENLLSRGQFDSYSCNRDSLFETINKYFDYLKDLGIESGAPLLIQQYSQILGKGHLANERRVSKEDRDWKGEIEEITLYAHAASINDKFSINLRNWRKSVTVKEEKSLLKCLTLDNIEKSLTPPCEWATKLKLRIHFEWIYDGTYVYIVQADVEQNYGLAPRIEESKSYSPRGTNFVPKTLHRLEATDGSRFKGYAKIKNPLLYNSLGLNTAPIYVLENQNEIDLLCRNKPSRSLICDLSILIKDPLVIRTDIDTDDLSLKQMLPRTEDMRNIEDVINWLIYSSKELSKKKLPFIFILHNFIPAFSSAFAYAEPNNRNVMVEALWGVPEGLYYYSHDKYIVDTQMQHINDIDISQVAIAKKSVNAKNNFILPTDDGKWICSQVTPAYIWRPAIPSNGWLKEIAINTRKIAESEGKNISVMWFVGVNNKAYGCDVFPWYHESCTYDYKQVNRKKNKGDIVYKVSQHCDIEKLRDEAALSNRRNIKYISIQPVEESIIRNKRFIEEIGMLAKDLNAVIQLEGGVLSHAYYQLIRTGATVDVANVFDKIVSRATHDKLVRDKIPDKIKKGGEEAITSTLSENELFEQLRVKLIEEAFELLEARDHSELVSELADIQEVVESILVNRKILPNHISDARKQKKEKVGGFEKGIVLHSTGIPVYSSSSAADENTKRNTKYPIVKGDKKERPGYTEILKKIKIPVHLKQWGTNIGDVNTKPYKHITLKGKRVNANLQIDISIITDEHIQGTLADSE